jgi:hypothetical protein
LTPFKITAEGLLKVPSGRRSWRKTLGSFGSTVTMLGCEGTAIVSIGLRRLRPSRPSSRGWDRGRRLGLDSGRDLIRVVSDPSRVMRSIMRVVLE